MKTVQQYLQELDTRKLIDSFLLKEPIIFDNRRSKLEMTVRQIRTNARKYVRDYIHRLRSIEIIQPENGHHYALYVHKVIYDRDDYWTSLVDLEELAELGVSEACPSWAYEFNDQSEIVGYYVADTELNKEHIYQLIADVMYEASFFGFKQETLAKNRKDLEESKAECDEIINLLEEGKVPDWLKDQEGRSLLRKQHEDETESELRETASKACYEFDKYCWERELKTIRENWLSLRWQT